MISLILKSPRLRHFWLIRTIFFLQLLVQTCFLSFSPRPRVLLQEREEDQRILVLTFEALRLLGNAIVALSDLRLNLLGPVPRHLHVLRPFSHYTAPVTLPGAVHHHIPVQVSTGNASPLICLKVT